MKGTLAISIALVVGCVAGATTSHLVVPPVRAGTNPPRWEYICKDDLEKAEKGFDAALNELGAQGWELVHATHDRKANWGYRWEACFKRPVG